MCCKYTSPSRWDTCTRFLRPLYPPLSLFQIKTCIFSVTTIFHFYILCYPFSHLFSSPWYFTLPILDTPSSIVLFSSTFFSLFSLSVLYLSFFFPFPFFYPKTSIFSVSAFPVLDENVNADPIMVSNDEFDALHSSLTNELVGSGGNLQTGVYSH